MLCDLLWPMGVLPANKTRFGIYVGLLQRLQHAGRLSGTAATVRQPLVRGTMTVHLTLFLSTVHPLTLKEKSE